MIVRGKEQVESLSVELQAAWAQYTFSSLPEGASISVDEVAVGSTPVSLKLEEGSRQLEVTADGFKPFKRSLAIVAKQDVVVPEISLIPADGVLEVSTQPANAAVILNGEYLSLIHIPSPRDLSTSRMPSSA